MTQGEALLLTDVRIVDPSQSIDFKGELLVRNGVVTELAEGRCSDRHAERIPLNGAWLLPALADLHVGLCEPGLEHRESMDELFENAVRSGYSSLLSSPATNPANDCRAVTEFIIGAASRQNRVDLLPIAANTCRMEGNELSEIGELLDAGAVALSDGGRPLTSPEVVRRVLEYARQFGARTYLRCEDPSLAAGGVMHEGSISTRLGLAGIPSIAESSQVYLAIEMARLTGAALHLRHLSSKESVELLRRARTDGLDVTCDVTPMHLWFTDDEVRGYPSRARISPPLRSEADRQALLDAVNDGTIDAIASGHCPRSSLEKDLEFEASAPGCSSLQITLGAILTLIDRGWLDAGPGLRATCCGPFSVAGISGGSIRVGQPADLVVVDPSESWMVRGEDFLGKSHSTVFEGKFLKGRVRMTLHRGLVVYSRSALS